MIYIISDMPSNSMTGHELNNNLLIDHSKDKIIELIIVSLRY